MPKKLSTDEWIAKARSIHGERYDYSQVSYENATTPVTILCRIHGPWKSTPTNHLRRGCPACGGSQRKTKELFERDAKRIHQEKYSYEQVEYHNSHTVVAITCPTHGVFRQSPTAHLAGQGCPECGKEGNLDRIRKESVLLVEDELLSRFGGRIRLKPESFTSMNRQAGFICETHGEFLVAPARFTYGNAECPMCVDDRRAKEERRKAYLASPPVSESEALAILEPHLADGIEVSGLKFGEEKCTACLECELHGSFELEVTRGLSAGKCPACQRQLVIDKRAASIKETHKQKRADWSASFIERAIATHEGKYDYSKVEYVDAKTPVVITCPIHGDFKQPPDYHLSGGCRLCADGDLAGLYSNRFFELRPDLKNAPALVYCLHLLWNGGECFKVGITRTTLNVRFAMAKASGVRVEVLATLKTDLYQAWRFEQNFLSRTKDFRYDIPDRTFARRARISPTELIDRLPDDWQATLPWSDTVPYWLT